MHSLETIKKLNQDAADRESAKRIANAAPVATALATLQADLDRTPGVPFWLLNRVHDILKLAVDAAI